VDRSDAAKFWVVLMGGAITSDGSSDAWGTDRMMEWSIGCRMFNMIEAGPDRNSVATWWVSGVRDALRYEDITQLTMICVATVMAVLAGKLNRAGTKLRTGGGEVDPHTSWGEVRRETRGRAITDSPDHPAGHRGGLFGRFFYGGHQAPERSSLDMMQPKIRDGPGSRLSKGYSDE